MPAKREYNVRGTKDFIVLAGIFFFLGIWAVKDAWFTSPKVLEKHPHAVAVSFDTAGSIGRLTVTEGDSISEGQVLGELRRVRMLEEFETAKKNYSSAKSEHEFADKALRDAVKNGISSEEVAGFKQERIDAQEMMDRALEEVSSVRARLDSTELHAPSKGVVKEIVVPVHGQIEAGETVLIIDPKDHFYLFNKSLAIFSLIAFCVFLGIHILAQ